MPEIPTAATAPKALCSPGHGLYLQHREQRAAKTQKASGDVGNNPCRILQAKEASRLPALQHAKSRKYHYSSNIMQHLHTESSKPIREMAS